MNSRSAAEFIVAQDYIPKGGQKAALFHWIWQECEFSPGIAQSSSVITKTLQKFLTLSRNYTILRYLEVRLVAKPERTQSTYFLTLPNTPTLLVDVLPARAHENPRGCMQEYVIS